MSALLVSVRSAEEAIAAHSAGADLIDVKEPSRGPLGMADPAVWDRVRTALPVRAVLSVALGEWNERRPALRPAAFRGISFRKVGLSGLAALPRPWDEFDRFRDRFAADATRWVYVVYADWTKASAPEPDAVISAALKTSNEICAGVLIDTWKKNGRNALEADLSAWSARIRSVQASGRFAALAGGLDAKSIKRLGPFLKPDLFAVRGAACEAGERLKPIDPKRVADLVAAVRSGVASDPGAFSQNRSPANAGIATNPAGKV